MLKKDLKKYREINIAGMNQRELIVFLYDSALRLMDEGKSRIAASDIPGTNEKLDRARKIFLHLLGTLDIEAGGEFAKKLSALYSYFVEKITMANVTHSAKELDEIIPIAADLKDAWEKMEYETPSVDETRKKAPGKQIISMEV